MGTLHYPFIRLNGVSTIKIDLLHSLQADFVTRQVIYKKMGTKKRTVQSQPIRLKVSRTEIDHVVA